MKYHKLFKNRDKQLKRIAPKYAKCKNDAARIRVLQDIADVLDLGDGKITEDDPPGTDSESDESDSE